MIEQAVLDADSEKIGEAVNPLSGAERLAGGETILFVEDEPFVREVTAEVLRGAGYRVLTATNAATAARTYDLLGRDVDLLLADIGLPGENGCALAEKLRQSDPELKVLFTSGHTEYVAWRKVGREICLAKPFSVEALLEKVRQVLDRAATADRKNS